MFTTTELSEMIYHAWEYSLPFANPFIEGSARELGVHLTRKILNNQKLTRVVTPEVVLPLHEPTVQTQRKPGKKREKKTQSQPKRIPRMKTPTRKKPRRR